MFSQFSSLAEFVRDHQKSIVRAAQGNMRSALVLLDDLVSLHHRGKVDMLEERLAKMEAQFHVRAFAWEVFAHWEEEDRSLDHARSVLQQLQERGIPWTSFLDALASALTSARCLSAEESLCKSTLTCALFMISQSVGTGGCSAREREFHLFALFRLRRALEEVLPGWVMRQ